MNSHEVFIHIHQGCFAGTGAIVRLPQCQWSKPDGYGKISQCITTTKHSKAKTVCIFLGIYCTSCLQLMIKFDSLLLCRQRWRRVSTWQNEFIPGPEQTRWQHNPDSKVHGANMGPTWVLSAPRWASCWPHDSCCQGKQTFSLPSFSHRKKHCNEES